MDQMHSATSARNAEFPWDRFNASSYWEHNYRLIRDDDAEVLELTQAWFASALADARLGTVSAVGADALGAPGAGLHGLDVGCGPNLYPGLAMLPLCRTVTLLDYSAANVAWLRSHLEHCDEVWRPYWELVSPAGSRGGFDEARAWLAERGRIAHGNLFDLPEANWDLGTMFFVAESITEDHAEFDVALTRFLRALRPGAPFAAAFMEQSLGYEVDGIRFRSVAVGIAEIDAYLAHRTSELKIHRVEIRPAPLRAGYAGMLLALGRV